MNDNFGTFLKQKRQEKNLTQKELATLLFVSESAVSKWEKNVAHPDISLLPKLSEILGTTEHELITASIDKEFREEKAQAKKWQTFSTAWDLFFYIAYGVALLVCFICNLAVDKTLSWFWIVFSALLLSFCCTNLPKLINTNKVLFIPLSIYLSLCLLLGMCCVYTGGNWFWIPVLSVLLAYIIIFVPIYISKYEIFSKLRKYNDFLSIGIDFLALNVLLIVINMYTSINGYSTTVWYLHIALPILLYVYLSINLLLCIRFLKLNGLLKTSLILTLSNVFVYIIPMFIHVQNPDFQRELADMNVFQANFACWQPAFIERNIHCILFLTVLTTALVFLIFGLIANAKKTK